MLKLTNIENYVELEFYITGYEFPDNPEDNWLLLKVKVKQGNQIFERVDAALETTELMEIDEWLTCLSHNRLPPYARLTFTEPCISFEFLACKNEKVRISIHLNHEMKPDFDLEQFKSKHRDWGIVFELDSRDFEKAIDGVKAAMNLYPVRGRS